MRNKSFDNFLNEPLHMLSYFMERTIREKTLQTSVQFHDITVPAIYASV